MLLIVEDDIASLEVMIELLSRLSNLGKSIGQLQPPN